MKSIIFRFFSIFVLFNLSFTNYSSIDSNLDSLTPAFLESQSTDTELEQSLEGSISIIWDESSETGLEPTYFLTSLDGTQTELLLTPEIIADFKAFIAEHHNLSVFGFWDSDHSKFIVHRFGEGFSPGTEINETTPRTERSWTIDGSKITGNTPWITVLCKFPDIPDEPHDLAYYQDMYGSVYPELNNYWQEASNNVINLDGSAVAGWYTLPFASDSPEYTTGATLGLLWDHCLAAADSDVDFSQYYGVNFMFNHNIWGFFAVGGCGTYVLLEGEYRHAGFTTTFPGLNGGLGNLVHEMGHGYCLPHSFVNEGDNAYINNWDVMSNSYTYTDPYWGYLPQHTIALNKYNLGWIDESKVLNVQMPFDQTFTLARTAQPQTEDYRMVKIVLDEDTFYTLETRQTSIPYDSQLPATAVIIHKYNTATDKISLLTEDYGISSTYPEAYWTVGETYIDLDYGLTFTITGTTDTGFVINLSLNEMTPFDGCSAQSSIPVPECEALVDLYNELDGPNWIGPRGWMNYPDPCMWTGVTCTDGVITNFYLLTESLTGELPPSIGAMTNLIFLTINGNLSGAIPPELGNLSQLERLDLQSNQLTGSIPPELGGLSNLANIYLSNNHLIGQIPPELGGLRNLTYLDLSYNQLTGSIPPELSNLNLLMGFWLSGNFLTGNLPAELGDMDSLQSLTLDDNPLYGFIPMTFTQLTTIKSFSFRNTFLCEPDDPEYQNWHETYIPDNYFNDGSVCIEIMMKSYLPLLTH